MFEPRPLVSVCITAYNHVRYIRESLLSVLNQKGEFDLEILIGDDGSSDGTRDVIRELAGRHPGQIKPHFHERNLGASENLVFLVSRTQGHFIAHLDGDDYWLADKLQSQLTLMSANPECAAVYGNGLVINQHAQLIAGFHTPLAVQRLDLSDVVERGNFLFHSSLLYRSVFKGEITDIPGSFIDFRVHIRLAKQGYLLVINEPVATYRHASSSSMIRHMPNKVFLHYWEALQEAAQLGVTGSAQRAAGLFWERMFITSLRHLNFENIAKWWRICGADGPIGLGLAERVWLIVRSLRLVFLALYSRFQTPTTRVLYRR